MPKSSPGVLPPNETVATLEDYENAHDDYKIIIDGRRYVCALTTHGTALIPIEEDRDK